MDWSVIITSSVVATIASTGMNYFTSLQLKKTEFKYDYNRYILERRKDAYNLIEEFIGYLTTENETGEYLNIFSSEKDLADFKVLSNKLKKKQMWLSDEIYNYIKNAIGTISDLINNGYPIKYLKEEELPAEVDDLETELSQLLRGISFCYFRDLKLLDNIKVFQQSNKYFDPSRED